MSESTDKYLNEKVVLDFYLEQIANNNIKFLKGRERHVQAVQKNILLLREEDNMHNKIEIAKTLWKSLFEAAMSYIDPDKRGYDDLFKFFDKYVNFEELIFASDSFYRDHTLHCLWVYFLGEYINREKQFENLTSEYENQKNFYLQLKSSFEECNVNNMFKEVLHILNSLCNHYEHDDSIRCIAALTHDLGYPLKKVYKINKSIKEILPYFSIENYDEFNFSYSNIQQNFINDFINFMCMHFQFPYNINSEKHLDIFNKTVEVGIDGNNSQVAKIKKDIIEQLSEEDLKLLGEIFKLRLDSYFDNTKHMKYSCDFEEYNHGIMSAFLLCKTLECFRNITFEYLNATEIKWHTISFPDFMAKQQILQSITNHTSKGYQISSISDFSSFLILMDELEEFSRISRANQNRQYINEFCKTNIYVENSTLNVDFIFDNSKLDNLDPELAFKGRCKRFLTLFNIPNMSENLKIRLRCIGHLPYDKNIYTLEIGKKHANILINDEEQNIPAYLKSTQFYTKEEYSSM